MQIGDNQGKASLPILEEVWEIFFVCLGDFSQFCLKFV